VWVVGIRVGKVAGMTYLLGSQRQSTGIASGGSTVTEVPGWLENARTGCFGRLLLRRGGCDENDLSSSKSTNKVDIAAE
jgi:hypothetical protein